MELDGSLELEWSEGCAQHEGLAAVRIVLPNIACHGTEVHEQPELAMGAM